MKLSVLLLSLFALLATQALAQSLPSTELVADSLEMTSTDTETTALCVGNVMLTGTNLKITCDRLEIVAARVAGEDDTIGTMERFKHLIATGSVRIVQGDREATCGRAEVLPREEKVILTDEPVLLDHSTEMVATGERIVLLRGQRKLFGEHIKITGPPIKDLGPGAEAALNPSSGSTAPVPAAPDA